MHRTVAAALVAALALALASCGGSETTTVSRAELVSRLETACLAGQRLTATSSRPSDPKKYLGIIIKDQKYVLGRVGNLETNAQPAKRIFDGFKAMMRKRLAALERIVAASSTDFQRVVAQERPFISATGAQAHGTLVALGARHVCI